MYSLQDFRKAIKNPKLVLRELNRLYYTRFYRRDFNTSGTDVVEEDWDNLVILDACRFDMFEERNIIEGDLEERVSRGSATIGFLRGNFRNREMHDTVYLTSNPQLNWHQDELNADFFKVIDIWEDKEYWDDEYSSVPPEKLVEKAKEVSREYPDKRLIVHFMQPHYPFLPAEEGQEPPKMGLEDYFWHNRMRGENDVSKEEAWKLYKSNLDRVLGPVRDLMEHLSGKTVVTSDHGNFVGERASPFPVREWGHPIGIYDETLVKVPWLVLNSDERKEVVEEEPEKEESNFNEEEVKDKLAHLGYK